MTTLYKFIPHARDGLELALLFLLAFSLLFIYLCMLLFINSPGKKNPLPESGVILYRFYLALVACTLLITIVSLLLLPHYFSAGGILWLILLAFFFFLLFLRGRDTYRYVIIAGEIDGIQLASAVLVCAGGLLYSMVFVFLEVSALLGVAASEMVQDVAISPETRKASPPSID